MLGLFLIVLSVGATRLGEGAQVLQAEGPIVCVENCDYINIDCQYGAWGGWSLCTTTEACGGAWTTSRSRIVTRPSAGLGAPCTAALVDVRACTEAEKQILIAQPFFSQKCQVPCLVGNWTKASSCSVTTANCPATRPATASIFGIEVWSRVVTQQPQYGGAQCPNLQETRPCEVLCKYDCVWGPWNIDYGQCSSDCLPPDGSIPLQQYTRVIRSLPVNGGALCTGLARKYEGDCQIADQLPACCQGCTDLGWSPWTACVTSTTYGGQPCGVGVQRRSRTLLPPDSFIDSCPESPETCGVSDQQITCCRGTCPVDCVAGSWGAWSGCTNQGALQCGMGTRTRTRNLSQPKFGGKPCGDSAQVQSCVLAPCATPCVMDSWGPWSSCGVCGPRVFQNRTRVMIAGPTNGGTPCPPALESRACDCVPCPINCKVGEWSRWGPCDQPCGPATQRRSRDIVVEPMYGGYGCPALYAEQKCAITPDGFVNGTEFANKPCDVNCEVTPWTPWTPCTKSCSSEEDKSPPGTQSRTRSVTVPPQYKGVPCPITSDLRYCNTQCCPVNCAVSSWSPWSSCSASCGGGSQRRERRITTFSRCGGADCGNLPFYEDRPCNTDCCARECVYYPYGAWTACLLANGSLATCGQSGTKSRTREVMYNNPCDPTSCGTLENTVATVTCRPGACTVDCEMGPWGQWSTCSAGCGWGSQTRLRDVSVYPANGGSPCPCNKDIRPCKVKDCCPTCSITPWSAWGGCSATCGLGVQHRRRYVNGTNSACDTAACDEFPLLDSRECSLGACEVPCSVTSWSNWSPCDVTCGLGVSTRTREVTEEGDGACPWLEEQLFCNDGPCPIPCIYSEWSTWSTCPLTCQPATSSRPKQVRRRYPIQGAGQASCPLEVSQEKDCILYPCRTLCQVSPWSAWSECSPSLGWGQKTRTRTVTTVPSAGEGCPELIELDFCYNQPPPSPCEWSTWFDWGQWSATCGPVSRQRQRILLSAPTTVVSDDGTAVTYDLEKCSTLGAPYAIQVGNLAKCPVDCVVSKWTPWSKCEYPGFRFRHRTVLVHNSDGGTPCPECLEEVDRCNVRPPDFPPNSCEVQPCPSED